MKRRLVDRVIEKGRALTRVPLGRSQEKYCEIWEDDYRFLLKLGMTGNFNAIGNNYVTAASKRASGSHVLVARVLLDAGPGDAIRYLDKNPLNLRRENLKLVSGGNGIRRDRDYLPRVAA